MHYYVYKSNYLVKNGARYTRGPLRGHGAGGPISRVKQRLLIWTPGPWKGTLVYLAQFCYQIMTLIEKKLH